MLKRMVKSIVKWATDEKDNPDVEPNTQRVYTQDVLAGAELHCVVYKVTNGYIMRISGGSLGMTSGILYCETEDDISKQLVAHRAKSKIIPDTPSATSPSFSVKTAAYRTSSKSDLIS